ncbi:MAG: hypothetical protein IPK16_05010 [Anaerolineales bacterium]|nr:hypothetical protein [Anaerolineales bacterium]
MASQFAPASCGSSQPAGALVLVGLVQPAVGGGRHISILWDGTTLQATFPVQSSLPVEVQKRIQIHHTDEFDFDPLIELTSDSDSVDTSTKRRFRPTFQATV